MFMLGNTAVGGTVVEASCAGSGVGNSEFEICALCRADVLAKVITSKSGLARL
jgi:hypothetical protein